MASSDFPEYTGRGSVEMLDSYKCDACKMDGKKQEAKYFCADCEDYMCATCEAHHKKVKSTRLHNVLSGDRIPKKEITKRTTIAGDSESSVNKSTPAEEPGHTERESTPAEDLTSRTKTRSSSWTFLDATVTPYMTLDTALISDTFRPLIKGFAFNPDGELLVADHSNGELKIFDNKFTLKAQLSCDGAPSDVAVINDKEAVVAVIDKQWLLYVKFRPNIKCGRTVILNKKCHSVTATKENIFVVCISEEEVHPSSIFILDLNGIRQRVINSKTINIHLYDINSIAANPLGNKIYMTCPDGIVCMTGDCKVLFTLMDTRYDFASGIVVDGNDNALITRFRSSDIQIMKSDGTHHKTFMTSSNGIVNPGTLAYRHSDGCLVVHVMQGLTSKVLVYKIR